MPEEAENEIKIYMLAKDLNLASGVIIEFLNKNGYAVTGPMSTIEKDMMRDIATHFKINKDVADRYQRKIVRFKKTKRKIVENRIDVICPRCTNKINVREGIKILSCFTCGLQFKIESQKQIKQLFYRLFARIKSLMPNWFMTNWSKLVTKVENRIISETIIYESHCWYCGSPIKSIKTEVKGKNFLSYKIKILWLGNKKCPKDCNYFLCNECGRCRCDYLDPVLERPNFTIEKKWLEMHPEE